MCDIKSSYMCVSIKSVRFNVWLKCVWIILHSMYYAGIEYYVYCTSIVYNVYRDGSKQ